MKFIVRTADYEGPLEKLLDLVQERKMHISDISLADVASAYLSYVTDLSEGKMNEISEFLSIATTLLLLKSRSLLPNFALTKEEETSAEELKERLKNYQIVRRWRSTISAYWKGEGIQTVQTQNTLSIKQKDVRLPTVNEFRERMGEVIYNLPKPLVSNRIRINTTARLADILEMLSRRFETSHAVNYTDLVGSHDDKVSKLLHFLALLELLKRDVITVNQDQYGGEITIESRTVNTPKYV